MHRRSISRLALAIAGYDSAFHGQKSYNGVAILSKTELTDVVRRFAMKSTIRRRA